MIEKEYPVKIKALTEIQEFINNFCGDNSINTKAATKIAVCTDEVVQIIFAYNVLLKRKQYQFPLLITENLSIR